MIIEIARFALKCILLLIHGLNMRLLIRAFGKGKNRFMPKDYEN